MGPNRLTRLAKTGWFSGKIANAVGHSVIDTAEARMTAGDVSAPMIGNAAQSRIMRSFTRYKLMINLAEQKQSIRDYPESAPGYLGQALSLRIGLRYGWIDGDEEATRKRLYDLGRQGVELAPVLSDQCELVSARTVKLYLNPRRDRATQQERRRG